MSPQERLPGHALAAGRLHLDEPQAFPITDAQTALVEHAVCGFADASGLADQTTIRPKAVSTNEPGHG